MPNIWTHMLFCEDIVDTIGNPNSFSKHEAVMKLGAQGPNPFFYYNFRPWFKNKSKDEISTLLHKKQYEKFLLDLIIAAKEMDKHVSAYVFGFITHHILDRHILPYIHYYAEFMESKHHHLEVIIDTVLMEKFHNLQTWKAPVYKEIDVGFSIHEDIVHLLCKMIKRNYPEISSLTPKYIQKSYRDMKLALRILADPYGWKNIVFHPLISSYSHQPIKVEVDYLNLNEAIWYHPATNKPRTESFLQLYEQAKIEGIEIMTEVMRYWHDNDDDRKSIHRITERIMNTTSG